MRHLVLALVVWGAAATSGLSQSWVLTAVEANDGPLNCDPPGGLYLDWWSRTGQQDGVVMFQKDDAKFQAVLDWTRPRYIPEADAIYFEMGNVYIRSFESRSPRLVVSRAWHSPNGKVGNFIGYANTLIPAGSGRTSGAFDATLGVRTASWPGVTVRVSFTDGGRCNEQFLVDYVFQKQ